MEASADTAEIRGVSLLKSPRPEGEDAPGACSIPESTEMTP